jgi:hypothetical protein
MSSIGGRGTVCTLGVVLAIEALFVDKRPQAFNQVERGRRGREEEPCDASTGGDLLPKTQQWSRALSTMLVSSCPGEAPDSTRTNTQAVAAVTYVRCWTVQMSCVVACKVAQPGTRGRPDGVVTHSRSTHQRIPGRGFRLFLNASCVSTVASAGSAPCGVASSPVRAETAAPAAARQGSQLGVGFGDWCWRRDAKDASNVPRSAWRERSYVALETVPSYWRG